ncbi:pilus assembly protein TadG [Paenarthrobacter sp. DKR-5]|uniref:pilus assembly protein TadG-related protein n=1 Tax=Paenarthrobacter sp. DKR-5 TaxID=2835535 RepID=UPI001BDCD316|nr:pilus assembly protein TadG-related protein [Paenarthrobacter sp. DKR-5]MBT1001045.1 pilus assembly protein TadG [Paenarthrobacter sp. DKR-5]
MRRLIARFRTLSRRDERGAVAITAALVMVSLLGCGAIAVDVGAIYAARAQVQNGADAAALAVAQDCAKNGTGACSANATSTAQTYANGNANTGITQVAPPTFPTANTVQTSVQAADAGGTGVGLFFAKIFGIDRIGVPATATATWGGPSSGPTAFPLVFEACAFNLDGSPQVLDIHTGGCDNHNPSGQNAPGQFGWLDQTSGTCSSDVTVGSTTSGNTGVAFPGTGNCDAVLATWKTEILAGQPAIAILPIYSNYTGSGTNATYTISSFVAFRVLGWSFSGGRNFHNTGTPSCTGSCNGIIGQFVHYVTLDPDYTPGGPNNGANVAYLVK